MAQTAISWRAIFFIMNRVNLLRYSKQILVVVARVDLIRSFSNRLQGENDWYEKFMHSLALQCEQRIFVDRKSAFLTKPHTFAQKVAVYLFFAITGLSFSSAQISLNGAVQGALEHHPQLSLAKSNIAIAQAKLIDAGKLDNPFLEFALASQVKDGPDREGSMFVGYSQSFPITDKLLRQSDLGKADVQVACAEVREVERNFIDRVQNAYIRALGAKALMSEMARIESSTQKSIDAAQNQAAMSLGSELDVASAETEKVLAAQDRLQAEGSYRQALAALRPLLGMQPNEELRLSDDLETVISNLSVTISEKIHEHQPRADIVVAQVKKQQALANQELARSETLEDWEFRTGYEAERTVDAPNGAERERLISLGLKIPLPVRQKGEGRIAEARARSEKADHEIAVAKALQQAEVTSAIAEVQAAKATASALKSKVLPQLKDRENETWRAYEQGLTDFNKLILLQQQQARIHKATTQARLDQALAQARLQHALGSHPALKAYAPCDCPSYKPDSQPQNAPWALPVVGESKVVKKIKALPVIISQPKTKKSKEKNSGSFQRLVRKLFGKTR